MPYADFSLERVEADFGLTARPIALSEELTAVPVPAWLTEILARGRRGAALINEKSRSEFIVAPVLTAAQDFTDEPCSIFSGQRMDVDPARGLFGECDFILARTPAIPRLKAPILTVVEAKKGDIELGLGQCAAQMVAARIFNERAAIGGRPLYGCVTTGDDWQFLKLQGEEILYDVRRLYLSELGLILAFLKMIVTSLPAS